MTKKRLVRKVKKLEMQLHMYELRNQKMVRFCNRLINYDKSYTDDATRYAIKLIRDSLEGNNHA